MRLFTYAAPDRQTRVGAAFDQDGRNARDISAVWHGSALHSADDLLQSDFLGELATLEAKIQSAPTVDLAAVRLLPPLLRPGKIVAVGLNYRDHIQEMRLETPSAPILFAKFASSLMGHKEPLRLPAKSNQVDYEAELAIIIGRAGKSIPASEALDHVAGYTILNDVSARDLQFHTSQWTKGKMQDGFAPCGPFWVTAEEIPDPQNLHIRLLLNGEVMQDGHTRDMVFSVAELIAYISEDVTLYPGDIIATGTPRGVGHSRRPPRYLQPGDEVRIQIDGLGELTTPVTSAQAAADQSAQEANL